MSNGKNVFDQPIKSSMTIHHEIRKIPTGQADDYTTGCFLNYNYFKNYYNMIAIDVNKNKSLDADPNAIQQINFTGNLEKQSTIFFHFEEIKKTVSEFL